jgi:hypothetical protein
MATQNVVEGQEIEVRVPPAPAGLEPDQIRSCQKRADPFSSTAMQETVVGHDTPYGDEEPLDSTPTGADQLVPPVVTELVVAEQLHATIVITADTNINRCRSTRRYLPDLDSSVSSR